MIKSNCQQYHSLIDYLLARDLKNLLYLYWARSIPEPKKRLEGRVFLICGHWGVWKCARFIYAKFAQNAKSAHIVSLEGTQGWEDQLKQHAGSMFYYSLYGETTTEATDPILMRESSIISKAGFCSVRFLFLRS